MEQHRSTRQDRNVVTAVNVGGTGRRSEVRVTQRTTRREARMSEIEPQGLTEQELEEQSGEALPDREAMSLISANVAAPVNAAVALNALSDDSVAIANAEQTADITQSN